MLHYGSRIPYSTKRLGKTATVRYSTTVQYKTSVPYPDPPDVPRYAYSLPWHLTISTARYLTFAPLIPQVYQEFSLRFPGREDLQLEEDLEFRTHTTTRSTVIGKVMLKFVPHVFMLSHGRYKRLGTEHMHLRPALHLLGTENMH
jgi:hypothetical protein